MLSDNRGYQSLYPIISHVCNACGESVFSEWAMNRFPSLEASLEKLAAKYHEVDVFIGKYSATLVDSLMNLIGEGDVEAAAEGLMDLLEDMQEQAQEMENRQSISRQQIETPVLPGVGYLPMNYANAA